MTGLNLIWAVILRSGGSGLIEFRSDLDRRIQIRRLGLIGVGGSSAEHRRRARTVAGSPDFIENGRPGLQFERGLHGEHDRDAGSRSRGSARCAEAAESNRDGEGRRASSDELMRWRESEKERGRESASFLSPQRSSGGGRARQNGGESTTSGGGSRAGRAASQARVCAG